MAGAHRYALRIEDRAEIVGMHTLHVEGEDGGLVRGGADELDVRQPRQLGGGELQQVPLVRRDRVDP